MKSKQQKLPASLKIAQARIESLEAKNTRLEKENAMLLEQFVVWQYNAHKYGLSIAKLNEPMNKKFRLILKSKLLGGLTFYFTIR